jgi:Flp pilus assembly protein CpaB
MASLALSVAAALFLRSYVGRAASVAQGSLPELTVLVATHHIERGHALAPRDVHPARIPVAFAPPGAVTQIAKAAGRVALADLSPGEVVTETRLARVRAGPVASLIPPGLRAFAVPTSLYRGLVVPGDRVDVLATFNTGQPHTEIVVSGVEILFVLGGNQIGQSGPAASEAGSGLDLDAGAAGVSGATSLILLVSQEQQERLAFARAFANLEVTMAPLSN